jgi:hypothetical protein
MKPIDAIKSLRAMDQRGVYVFSKKDLAKLFPNEQEKALEKSLQRLVRDGLLERAVNGVYVNPMAQSKKGRVIEDVAAVMRRGEFSYVSLESMLSEYGLISQVPISRITIMTTGAPGTYKTPYGTIEFTHTKRAVSDIIRRTRPARERPLRIATPKAAVQDLLRVGRNKEMIDMQELAAMTESDEEAS